MPNEDPTPHWRRPASSSCGARPPKSTVATPRPIAPVPRVTMNDGMPKRTCSSPLTRPKAVPVSTPASTAR
jgi:hypothetical protein